MISMVWLKMDRHQEELLFLQGTCLKEMMSQKIIGMSGGMKP